MADSFEAIYLLVWFFLVLPVLVHTHKVLNPRKK